MATAFKPTVVLNSLNKYKESLSSDHVYWKNFDSPVIKKEIGNIEHIDFSPASPFNYAITSSNKVKIYSPQSGELVHGLPGFLEAAHCGSFRSDGKLVVAGCDNGQVRLFEPIKKSILHTLHKHTDAVLVSKFLSDKLRIMTASKDRTVHVWDISQGEVITSFLHHFKDYIWCGDVSRNSPDMFLAGSYDHSVKLFDVRSKDSVLTVDHGCPVESVVIHCTGTTFVTAGGNVIKVWDAMSGGRQLAHLSHHHKTITSLAYCSRYGRLMSGSLDRHVKVYDTALFQIVHSMDFPAAILSLALPAGDRFLAVGMEGGLMSLQRRQKEDQFLKQKASMFPVARVKMDGDDVRLSNAQARKLEKHDLCLRRFQHSKALDAALELKVRVAHPEKTVGVIHELMRRGMLKASIAGRAESRLLPLLRFIQKNHWKQSPPFDVLGDVLNIIIELYEELVVMGSAKLQAAVHKILNSLRILVRYQQALAHTHGVVSSVLALANHSPDTSVRLPSDRLESDDGLLKSSHLDGCEDQLPPSSHSPVLQPFTLQRSLLRQPSS